MVVKGNEDDMPPAFSFENIKVTKLDLEPFTSIEHDLITENLYVSIIDRLYKI